MAEEKTTALVIKEHDFKEAKRSLQKYAEQGQIDVALSRVPTDGGLFNLGNHKVTGSELNGITSQIQDYLIKINTLSQGLVDEFGQVYKAFEALDKDYITGIVGAIKSAEEVSKKEQEDRKNLRDTVTRLDKTVDALAIFKAELDKLKLNKLEHITDVDEAWKLLERQEELVKTLSSFQTELARLKHIKDIDSVWEREESSAKKIDLIDNKIVALLKTIDSVTEAVAEMKRAVAAADKRQEHFIKTAEKALADRQTLIDQHLAEREKAIQDSLNSVEKALSEKQIALDSRIDMFAKEQADALRSIHNAQSDALSHMAEEQVHTLREIRAAQDKALLDSQREQTRVLQQIENEQHSALSDISAKVSDKLGELQNEQTRVLSNIDEEQSNKLASIKAEQDEELERIAREQIERLTEMNASLEAEKGQLNDTLAVLSKQVKISHIVAATSAALVIVQVILNILGVI